MGEEMNQVEEESAWEKVSADQSVDTDYWRNEEFGIWALTVRIGG